MPTEDVQRLDTDLEQVRHTVEKIESEYVTRRETEIRASATETLLAQMNQKLDRLMEKFESVPPDLAALKVRTENNEREIDKLRDSLRNAAITAVSALLSACLALLLLLFQIIHKP